MPGGYELAKFNVPDVAYFNFSNDDRYIAIGDDHGNVYVYDIESESEVTKFNGHNGAVWSLNFSSNDDFIVTKSYEDNVGIKVWNPKTGSLIKTIPYDGNTCVLSRDDSIVGIYNYDDLTIKVIDMNSDNLLNTINLTEKIDSFDISQDNTKLAYTRINSSFVKIFDLKENKTLYEINTGDNNQDLQFSLDSSKLYINDFDSIDVFSTYTGEKLNEYASSGVYFEEINISKFNEIIVYHDDFSADEIKVYEIIPDENTDNNKSFIGNITKYDERSGYYTYDIAQNVKEIKATMVSGQGGGDYGGYDDPDRDFVVGTFDVTDLNTLHIYVGDNGVHGTSSTPDGGHGGSSAILTSQAEEDPDSSNLIIDDNNTILRTSPGYGANSEYDGPAMSNAWPGAYGFYAANRSNVTSREYIYGMNKPEGEIRLEVTDIYPTPKIENINDMAIQTNSSFSFQVSDNNNTESVSYYFVEKPSGMSIDSNGLITWNPVISTEGLYNIEVGAITDRGIEDTQKFKIYVTNKDIGNNKYSIVENKINENKFFEDYYYVKNQVSSETKNVKIFRTLDSNYAFLEKTITFENTDKYRDLILRIDKNRNKLFIISENFYPNSGIYSYDINNSHQLINFIHEEDHLQLESFDRNNDYIYCTYVNDEPGSLIVVPKDDISKYSILDDNNGNWTRSSFICNDYLIWRYDNEPTESHDHYINIYKIVNGYDFQLKEKFGPFAESNGNLASFNENYAIIKSYPSITEPCKLLNELLKPNFKNIDNKNVYPKKSLELNVESQLFLKSDNITFSVSGLPTGATFDDTNNKIIWTPTENDIGTYNISVTASYPDFGSDTKEFTITVEDNKSPTLTQNEFNYIYGDFVQIDLEEKITDPENEEFTYKLLNTDGNLELKNNEIRFTSFDEDNYGLADKSGTYKTDIEITDSYGNITNETITINVEDVVTLNDIEPDNMYSGNGYYYADRIDYDHNIYCLKNLDNSGSINADTNLKIIKKIEVDHESDRGFYLKSDTKHNQLYILSPIQGNINYEFHIFDTNNNHKLIKKITAYVPEKNLFDENFITYNDDMSKSVGEYFSKEYTYWTKVISKNDVEKEINIYSGSHTTSNTYVTNRNFVSYSINKNNVFMGVDEHDNDGEVIEIYKINDDFSDYELVYKSDPGKYNSTYGSFTTNDGMKITGLDTGYAYSASNVIDNIVSIPTISNVNDISVMEGEDIEFSFTTSDPNGQEVTVTPEFTIPDGASFDQDTLTFSWPTEDNDAGGYTLRFKATNTDGYYDITTIYVTVNEQPNFPPEFEPIGPFTIYEGQNINFQVVAHDPDGDDAALTYWAEDLPAGATFDTDTQIFDWTPGNDDAGLYRPTFYVSDGEKSATTTFEVGERTPESYPINTITSPGGTIVNVSIENNYYYVGGSDGNIYCYDPYNNYSYTTIETICDSIEYFHISSSTGTRIVSGENDYTYIYNSSGTIEKTITDINIPVTNIETDWKYTYITTANGVHVYDNTNGYEKITIIDTELDTVDSAVDNDFIYYSDDNGIKIYDKWNNFYMTDIIDIELPVNMVTSGGDILYVAAGNEFIMYDKTNGFSEQNVRIPIQGGYNIVNYEVTNNYYFIVDDNDTVHIHSTTIDPDCTCYRRIGVISDVTDITDIRYEDGQLIITDGSGNIKTYDPDSFGHYEFEFTGINSGSDNYGTEYEPEITWGDTFTFTPDIYNPNNIDLTYNPINLPEGATLDPITGEFSWTPPDSYTGTFQVEFEAISPTGVTTKITVPIRVLNVGDISDKYEFETTKHLVLSNSQIEFKTPEQIIFTSGYDFKTQLVRSLSSSYKLKTLLHQDESIKYDFETKKDLSFSNIFTFTTEKQKGYSSINKFKTLLHQDKSNNDYFKTPLHKILSNEFEFKTNFITQKSKIFKFKTPVYRKTTSGYEFKTVMHKVIGTESEFKTKKEIDYDLKFFITEDIKDKSSIKEFYTPKHYKNSENFEFKTTKFIDITYPYDFKTESDIDISADFFITTKKRNVSSELEFKTLKQLSYDFSEFYTEKHIKKDIAKTFYTTMEVAKSSIEDFKTDNLVIKSSPGMFVTEIPYDESSQYEVYTPREPVKLSFFKTPKYFHISGEVTIKTRRHYNQSKINRFKTTNN